MINSSDSGILHRLGIIWSSYSRKGCYRTQRNVAMGKRNEKSTLMRSNGRFEGARGRLRDPAMAAIKVCLWNWNTVDSSLTSCIHYAKQRRTPWMRAVKEDKVFIKILLGIGGRLFGFLTHLADQCRCSTCQEKRTPNCIQIFPLMFKY